MRFKVFAAGLAAVALMSAAVGVASATNGPIHETTAETTTAIQTTATKLEPATGLVGDDQGTCALLRSGGVEEVVSFFVEFEAAVPRLTPAFW
jgi:hypothetical protein